MFAASFQGTSAELSEVLKRFRPTKISVESETADRVTLAEYVK
ncbi:MAG: hypothetical protein ABI682_00680 [Acidobacteriota bacterium]